jgi:hypothetical protein
MKKHLIFTLPLIVLFIFSACRNNATDSPYPKDADLVIDVGIIYASYNGAWFSVEKARAAYEVFPKSPATVVVKSGQLLSALDFGTHRFSITNISEPTDDNHVTVTFAASLPVNSIVQAYINAFKSDKYVEIRFECFAGCEEEEENEVE